MNADLFDINLDNIKTEIFQDSVIYTIDNFYKHPRDVENFIQSHPATLWKDWDTPTYNGVHFKDYRHDFNDDRFIHVSSSLENICGQSIDKPMQIATNKIKFTDYYFNDYFNNYWAPHKDLGYTGIVYFNSSGTNLYDIIEKDVWTGPEHFEPWRSKLKYQLIKTLEAKYNRLILFNGRKFLHGMSITNDDFFKDYRFNQALFFYESKTLPD
jgi:hypothetical protein